MSHVWTAQFSLLHFCVLIASYSYKSKPVSFGMCASPQLVLTESLVNYRVFSTLSLLSKTLIWQAFSF